MASDSDAGIEVSVKVGERWEIHARYSASEVTQAVEEAKHLEKVSKAVVRVVREAYDQESGLYKQTTVYKSAYVPPSQPMRAKPGTPTKRRAAAGTVSSVKPDQKAKEAEESAAKHQADEPSKTRPPSRRAMRPGPKRITVSGLAMRMLIVVLLSVLLAVIVTILGPSILPQVSSRMLALTGGNQSTALLIIFMAAFLVSFSIMSVITLSKVRVVGLPAGAQGARRKRGRGPKAKRRVVPSRDKQGAMPRPPSRSVRRRVDEDEELSSASENDVEKEPSGEDVVGKRLRFASFLHDLHPLAKDVDGGERFGVNLFLAGAVDGLASLGGMSEKDGEALLGEGARLFGTPADQAARFAERYQEYLMQPQYLEMYQAGRNALAAYLEGGSIPTDDLGAALESWRQPNRTVEPPGPLAVLFTDIVGSTGMTVRLGDDAAQHVLRTHNRIVRTALTNAHGREIKHTGDGIMAAFSVVSNAVEAAIDIQRRISAHNKAEGDVPLQVRIGINAGEPVVEDDDLFGATVQLAARVCNAADPDRIFVSDVVRGLCAGKGIAFVSHGTRELKGFEDPVPVFEADWRADAKASDGRDQG